MCSLLRAKGFTRTSPVGHVLVLVHYSAAKMASDLNSTLFSTKACVSIKELLRE